MVKQDNEWKMKEWQWDANYLMLRADTHLRMSGLSIPMPKATVATMTGVAPLRNAICAASRSCAESLPW